MVAKTALMLAWFALSYYLLVFAAETWWQGIPCALSLALAIGGLAFCVQHDANHGAYSVNPATNRLLSKTLDLLGGSSYVWRFKHNIAHHTYTNLSGADSDIEIPFTRLSPAQPPHPRHRHQRIYVWALYAVFVPYWQFYEDFKQIVDGRIARMRFPRPRGRQLLELLVGKLAFTCWALLVPMLFHPWWVVLLYYALVAALLGVLLAVVFELAHCAEDADFPRPHDETGSVDRPWAVHQVQATVDFAPSNRLLTWYVGGLNFQIEHHLFPKVCHVHYPQLAPIVRATCLEYGVRYTQARTFRQAFASHWRWLGHMARPLEDGLPTSGENT